MVEETDSTTIVITLSSDDVKFRLNELIIPVQIFNADPYEVNFSTKTITIQEGESASVIVSIINGQLLSGDSLTVDLDALTSELQPTVRIELDPQAPSFDDTSQSVRITVVDDIEDQLTAEYRVRIVNLEASPTLSLIHI